MRRFSLLMLLLLVLASSLPIATARVQAQTAVDTGVDVGLVIDNSGSMTENDPRNMRFSAAKLFINLLAIGDQVGVISLGDRDSTRTKLSLKTVSEYSTYDRDAFATPDDLANYTYMGESLDLATQLMENVAQFNEQRAVILLTDGLPTYRDEDRAAQEQKFADAVEAFKREGIKVFPIALGAAADVNFLQQTLAGPTGGRVVVAENASQLLRVYIDILAQLQEGRYVDAYDVLGNVETFLANVNPRQQIDQINFVFPEQNDVVPEITGLRLPRQIQSDTSKLSRVVDPNWSMWTARPQYLETGVEGEWLVNLASQLPQVPTIAVIQSNLRLQMHEPISAIADDDGATRYYPAGRPLMLRAAVRNQANDVEKRIGLFVQSAEAGSTEGFALTDDGSSADLSAVDGEYTGLFTQLLAPGTYRVNMHITPAPTHLRLQKAYDIVVEPLPIMQITTSPDDKLAPDEPVRIEARFALDGQPVEMESAEITAAVRREGRVIASVPLVDQGDGTWAAEYLPGQSGEFDFSITAHADWNSPDRGPRRYTDYVEVAYEASRQAMLQIDVAQSGAVPAVDSLRNGIQQTLKIRSLSDEPIELRLGVSGLPEGSVYPATLQIPPGADGNHTVTISTPAKLSSGEHAAQLTIVGANDVQISTTEIPFSFTINGWLAQNRGWLMLLVVLLSLLAIRRIRAWVVDVITRNVELLRYGGRA